MVKSDTGRGNATNGDLLASELSNFKRFVDSKNKKYTNPNGAMKVIKSRLESKYVNTSKINSSLSMKYKGKSIVEWNKYIKTEDRSGTKDNFSHFTFQDRPTYKIYLQLCDKRDSIPPCSPERIETLKKTDPVFTKRYRQFVFGTACGNKAVRYDSTDTLIPPFVPKFTIEKKKGEIIQKNKNKRIDKKLKAENELIREKTKHFFDSIESLIE